MDPDSLEGVVFDFDRTLAPLGNFVRWREALPLMRQRYLAHGIAEAFLDEAPRGCFGLLSHVGQDDALDPDRLAEAQREVSELLAAFETDGIGQVRLFDGAAELLADLGERGLRLGIVSSNPGPVIERILADEGVAGRFASVVGRERVRRIKPDPEGMRLCCSELGVRPGRVLSVGDNVGDVEAALAAGLPPVGVASGVSSVTELERAGALVVYDSVADLHRRLFGKA